MSGDVPFGFTPDEGDDEIPRQGGAGGSGGPAGFGGSPMPFGGSFDPSQMDMSQLGAALQQQQVVVGKRAGFRTFDVKSADNFVMQ